MDRAAPSRWARLVAMAASFRRRAVDPDAVMEVFARLQPERGSEAREETAVRPRFVLATTVYMPLQRALRGDEGDVCNP
jgi:hypothetical protein